MDVQKNVLGLPLKACCKFPMTGFMRDGYCRFVPQDQGQHTICIEVTNDFLEFSKRVGNDLSEAMPQFDFPGLIEGDRWCLCAARWVEAYQNKVAPKVLLSATHESILTIVPLEVLQEFAIDEDKELSLG